MARKKDAAQVATEPVEANQPAAVSDTNGTAVIEAPAPQNGKRKPDVTFSVFSDRTTRLSVSVWEESVTYDDRVSVKHTVMLGRSYMNNDGKWIDNHVFRVHDLPLVRSLLDRAHAWAVSRRTDDSSCPF